VCVCVCGLGGRATQAPDPLHLLLGVAASRRFCGAMPVMRRCPAATPYELFALGCVLPHVCPGRQGMPSAAPFAMCRCPLCCWSASPWTPERYGPYAERPGEHSIDSMDPLIDSIDSMDPRMLWAICRAPR